MQIVGHRGDPAHAPENTLASLEMSYRHGKRAFEVDVQLTADGVPIVMHDARLERTTSGSGRVGRSRWKSIKKLDAGGWFSPDFIGEPVSSLRQVLRAFRSRPVQFFLDVKAPGAERAIHQAIVRENALGRCRLAGYSGTALKRMVALDPPLPVYRVTGSKQPVTEKMIGQAGRLGLKGFLVYKRWVTPKLPQHLAAVGMELYVWTIVRTAEEKRMRRYSVTGIMSERCQK